MGWILRKFVVGRDVTHVCDVVVAKPPIPSVDPLLLRSSSTSIDTKSTYIIREKKTMLQYCYG